MIDSLNEYTMALWLKAVVVDGGRLKNDYLGASKRQGRAQN